MIEKELSRYDDDSDSDSADGDSGDDLSVSKDDGSIVVEVAAQAWR